MARAEIHLRGWHQQAEAELPRRPPGSVEAERGRGVQAEGADDEAGGGLEEGWPGGRGFPAAEEEAVEKMRELMYLFHEMPIKMMTVLRFT